MHVFWRISAFLLAVSLFGAELAPAQPIAPPVAYRLTFPHPEQRWMQVEARFTSLPATPLQVRMSRTSPGRYALHEFAKNVFEVRVTDGAGKALVPARPNLHQWDVAGHDGTVVVSYKVFGDRTDGTYLSVDPAHAHMNMPATLMWARGLGDRPARVTIVPPPGSGWKVATQLFATDDPFTFTAPNLAYLMDSPTEVSDFVLRTFTVEDGKGGRGTYRIALHHTGTEAEADAYARDVEKIVREAVGLFGEIPKFDAGTYTFLADYLPWASGDGMEHRNSTVLSSAGALRNPSQRTSLLGTVAHEYVHAWNMERIRSKGIEPFDFEEADVSGELWFGEGVTNYLEDLISRRSGMVGLDATLANWAGVINTIALTPGRRFRSAEDMSMLAPFVDAAVSIDRTAWPNLFISYYTFGEGIGLALDLALRGRSANQVSIDDYMQALWAEFGRPGQAGAPGVVTRPYTMDDLRATLGRVAGDQAFATAFFAKYVQGHELADYPTLLGHAGLIVRPRAPGRPWLGTADLQSGPDGRLYVASIVSFDAPLAKAGVAQDDVLLSLNGRALSSMQAVEESLAALRPGGRATLEFVRRSGERVTAQLPLEADPRIEIVPAEEGGGTLTPAQKQFRDRWLASRAR
jgi:predicted metalloprotease with PDZ domain